MNNLPRRHRVNRFNVKGVLCVLCAFAFFPFLANAEMYKWTDDEGVVHVTDDPTKIPDKYWIERKVRKEEARPTPPEPQPDKPAQPSQPSPATEKRELYGDYPLEWWVYRFRELKKNLSDNEEKLLREKNFVDVFEGGRRFGKIFTDEEISRYESYKTELPILEKKVNSLKDDLEELQRKATINGVPREIRE